MINCARTDDERLVGIVQFFAQWHGWDYRSRSMGHFRLVRGPDIKHPARGLMKD